MSYKDPEKQREYMRRWIADRRAVWFEGKICDECGSAENLQLDHRDPKQKVSHRIWSWSDTRREAELAKCRPLCVSCHKRKSALEVVAGVAKFNAKLTENDIHAIRLSHESCRVLALRYDVSFKTVSRIKNRVDWKHV